MIENKISHIQQRLRVAKQYQEYPISVLEGDPIKRSAVERELYIIAQAVIDLAEAMVAFKKFRKPTTMREAIEILGEEKVLPKEFVADFIKIVGFRNALAHDYEDLRLEVVYDVLQHKLPQVQLFLKYIQKVIKG